MKQDFTNDKKVEMITLGTVMEGLSADYLSGDATTPITGIVYDSRNAGEGDVFVALPSKQLDGHDFIADAYGRGTRCFVVEHWPGDMPAAAYCGATVVQVESTRHALALMSASWFGFPAKKLTVVALTGTKGKTTISFMLKSVFEAAGVPVGLIGSNGVFYGETYVKMANTTPESFELHRIMADMVSYGVKVLVLEATSQGFLMHRTDGIRFDIGVYTNIAPDHISASEHSSFEEYFACKKQIFAQAGTCLVNRDADLYDRIVEGVTCPLLTYGTAPDCDYQATDIRVDHLRHGDTSSVFQLASPAFQPTLPGTVSHGDGSPVAQPIPPITVPTSSVILPQAGSPTTEVSPDTAPDRLDSTDPTPHTDHDIVTRFRCQGPDLDRTIELGLPGLFNVSNALAAIGVADILHLPMDTVCAGLAAARVPGRVEVVDAPAPYTILIDFAHNRLSMEALIQAARSFNPTRILAVFGLEGNRSRARRFDCGEILGRECAYTILADASPRFDDPDQIIADIATGIERGGGTGKYEIIRDRRQAIPAILDMAEPGDIVLLIGKGNVPYDEVQGVNHPLNERQIVSDYFAR